MTYHARRGLLALATTLLLALAACGDSAGPSPTGANLLASGGGGQEGALGDTLPNLLVVRAQDDRGGPLVGYPIRWTTSEPTGTLIVLDSVTDPVGMARARWRLGMVSGAQEARATLLGYDDVAVFGATAGTDGLFKAIGLMRAISGQHMCALDADSLAWCWGGNYSGELGDGITSSEPPWSPAAQVPRRVVGDIHFASLYGAWGRTCGLTTAGALWCWGQNQASGSGSAGAFGNGTIESSPVPVRGAPDLVIAEFDMDAGVACAVTTDGRGYCWGAGDGALGNGGGVSESTVPVEILGDRRWRQIAVGDDRRCAVAEDWQPYCWAEAHLSRWEWIAVQPDAGPDDTPLPVAAVPAASGLTSSWYNQCGLSLSGASTAVCWGVQFTGAPNVTPPGPTQINLGSPIVRLITEGGTALALDGGGRLWAWGGDPEVHDGLISFSPVSFFPGMAWRDVSLGSGVHAISVRDSVLFHVSLSYFAGEFRPGMTPIRVP